MSVTVQGSHSRPFISGTTGWKEDDLYDPKIERSWEQGRYEIVEGVLTKMPAAYLEGSISLGRLVRQVERHLEDTGGQGEFGFDIDLVLNKCRVPKGDAVFLTPEQLAQQLEAQARHSKSAKPYYGRLRVSPGLIIESVSLGHELYDRQIKREWYRGFGIPNYWIFDAYRKSLECLRLVDWEYQTDVLGNNSDEIQPAMFSGLTIRLETVWM